MGAVLSVTAPIFGLAALGYLLVRRGIFAGAEMPVLGRFVMLVGMPAILFRAGADPEGMARLDLRYMAIYAAALVLTGAVTWCVALRLAPARRAVATLGAMAPNSGYIGFAILSLSLPGLAAPVLTMNTLTEVALVLPIGFALIELIRPGARPGWGAMLGRIAWAALAKPITIALLAGFALGMLGLRLPLALDRAVGMLAVATPALAMVYLGGTLAALPVAGAWRDAMGTAAARLLLAPAVMAGLLMWVPLAGMTPDLRMALILSTAMPMIGIYPILAAEAGEPALGALSLLLATVAGFVTLTALLLILG